VKPAGPTSHDIVDIVRRALGVRRVGHLGTLDPFATGLLVVVVGRATRLAPFAAAWDKAYEGTIRLGMRTTTDDLTGEPVATSEVWRGFDATAVRAALGRFRGPLRQRPPLHSAVKVEGERAYRRARRGETVDLPKRDVEIRELALVGYDPPDVRFRATVSGGTYLRSLARDVGEALACGAHLVALARTRVGPFRLGDAVPPEQVTAAALLEPAALVSDLPRRDLDEAARAAALHGRPLVATGEDQERVALFADGKLVAVAVRAGDLLKPRVVVADA
jgi:tRNA pseudouridine55 synthase